MHAAELVESHIDAWNHGDAQGVADHPTADGIYVDVPQNLERTHDELIIKISINQVTAATRTVPRTNPPGPHRRRWRFCQIHRFLYCRKLFDGNSGPLALVAPQRTFGLLIAWPGLPNKRIKVTAESIVQKSGCCSFGSCRNSGSSTSTNGPRWLSKRRQELIDFE